MNTNFFRTALFCSMMFVLFPLSGCKEAVAAAEEEAPLPGGLPKEPAVSTLTILAAGDNLIHDIIYFTQRLPGQEEAYNFDSCYAQVKGLVEEADIAFVNQETVMGGRQIGHSGYPVFNTPQEVGDALIKAGFDVANQASNHVMDRGEKAALATIDYWDARPSMIMLGLFRTQEDRDTKKHIIEKNGIKVGFLSYTYGLNGFSLPKDKPWLVPLIDAEVMIREIDRLRPLCDLLVVSMHWGNEFRHEISSQQKQLASMMAEHKVDLILGHHPHVTQPVEVIPRPDGGSLICYYSLGDFVSHTQSDWTDDTITGALAYIRVKKQKTGGSVVCTVETAGVIPTVCHYGKERRSPFVVYPLWDYTNELAVRHYKNNTSVESLNAAARRIFGPRIMSKEQYTAYERSMPD
jgi:poly-gamma-glutamate synthesis protein (capsule biosynthesis protein)